jgi:uncharacterized protein YodC (DUF2158 family)
MFTGDTVKLSTGDGPKMIIIGNESVKNGVDPTQSICGWVKDGKLIRKTFINSTLKLDKKGTFSTQSASKFKVGDHVKFREAEAPVMVITEINTKIGEQDKNGNTVLVERKDGLSVLKCIWWNEASGTFEEELFPVQTIKLA